MCNLFPSYFPQTQMTTVPSVMVIVPLWPSLVIQFRKLNSKHDSTMNLMYQ